MCCGLNKNGPHRSVKSGTTRRRGLAGVGMAFVGGNLCRPEEDAGSPGAAPIGSCGSWEPSEVRAGTEFTSFARRVRHLARPRSLHSTLKSVVEYCPSHVLHDGTNL